MGLALFGVRGYLTRLTRSWYLIRVGYEPIRTNHLRGSSYGYPDVVVSAEALLTSATEWRVPDWNVSLLLY